MTLHAPDPRCAAVRDDLAELALGTLSGVERSSVLAHVQGCADCRAEVDRLSSAADAILMLAPEIEPQAGFETRLFERMGVRPQRRRRLSRLTPRRLALAGGTLLGALGLGLGIGLSTGGGALSAVPIAANLTSDHHNRGEVYVAPGDPGWLFMSVNHLDATGLVTCRVKTVHGATTTVGTFWLDAGSGSWVSRLPVPADQIQSAWIVGGGGTVLASATLTR